jgi:NifU-like protein involved in Fe-S cluster formation
MFSSTLLDHFEHPRNAGKLADATVEVQVSNPVCGDILQLAARIDHQKIAEVRFLCRGCTTSIACASLMTEKLEHKSLEEAGRITPEELSEGLGTLPAATFHGAQLAIDALQSLLARARAR